MLNIDAENKILTDQSYMLLLSLLLPHLNGTYQLHGITSRPTAVISVAIDSQLLLCTVPSRSSKRLVHAVLNI